VPSTGNSRLFHRWLLILSAQDDMRYPVIEHHNDIPLDCRVSNLAKAVDAVNNNNATHRLAKAFLQDCVTRLIDATTAEREEYFGIIHKCPPLPDCVFENEDDDVVVL
jgi:hypothetical protein